MLRIRLRRVGKKHRPSYRIVVAESTSPRDGAYVDWIGHYDPLVDPPQVTIDEEKAITWFRRGARPSEPVDRIFHWKEIYEKAARQ